MGPFHSHPADSTVEYMATLQALLTWLLLQVLFYGMRSTPTKLILNS